MSDIVHESILFKRVDGAGWQEYTGQLVDTGEIRLLKDGACAVAFQLAKSALVHHISFSIFFFFSKVFCGEGPQPSSVQVEPFAEGFSVYSDRLIFLFSVPFPIHVLRMIMVTY